MIYKYKDPLGQESYLQMFCFRNLGFIFWLLLSILISEPSMKPYTYYISPNIVVIVVW